MFLQVWITAAVWSMNIVRNFCSTSCWWWPHITTTLMWPRSSSATVPSMRTQRWHYRSVDLGIESSGTPALEVSTKSSFSGSVKLPSMDIWFIYLNKFFIWVFINRPWLKPSVWEVSTFGNVNIRSIVSIISYSYLRGVTTALLPNMCL